MDAEQWDARYAAQDLVWSATPNEFVVAELEGVAPGRMLDLAGGEGRNAIWLAEQGWTAELVEFSQVALDKAQQLAAHRGVTLTTTCADVTAQPALDPADLVLLCYLQLPQLQLAAVIAHAGTLVAPGGVLLVIAHERDNLTRGFGGPPDAAVLPTVAEIVAVLRETDLTLERAEQVVRHVATEDGPREAIDLLVRARRS